MSRKSLQKLHNFILDENPNEKELSAYVKELAYNNEPTDRTVTVRYSVFKKHIRDNHPKYDDDFLKTLRPPAELTNRVISENKDRKMQRKLVSFNDKTVENILDLENSTNPYEMAIYLQFISGRRINEIFESPVRISKNPRELSMQLSKKNSKEKTKFFKFDLLKDTIDNATFKQKLNRLRTSTNGITLTDFTNRVNKKVRTIVDKDLSSHDLRGMYAVYRFETDNEDKLNMLGYINKVLNHNSTSVDSSQSYSNFKYES